MRATAAAVLAAIALVGRGTVVAQETADGGDGEPARVISYDADALTVRLVKVPVAEVLEEVGRQSGAEIRGQLREPRDVSAEFEAVPLAEALHRLLGNQNFALIYGEGGQLRAVKLLGGPQAAPATPVLATAAGVTTTTIASEGGLAGLIIAIDGHQPVPIGGRLSQILGADSATFRQLLELGMHHEDAGVRAEAVRTGLQVIENEPGFRTTVLGAVNGMDELSVVAILRGSAGERAEELAMHVATQSRVAELRTKASSILQRLRSGG